MKRKLYSKLLKWNNESIKIPKSPLKAYTEDNFKVYLSDIGLLRILSKISINEIIAQKNMLYKYRWRYYTNRSKIIR